MDLVLFSNKKGKRREKGSNRISPKNRQMAFVRRLRVKRQGQTPLGAQNRVLYSFLDPFSLSNAKLSTRKAYVQGCLVSLTLGLRTIF